jgi:molybdopterin-containing oxidoreductase family iron-sulfur binding subunit
LDELAAAPEFQAWAKREFPDGASELADPVSRRHFLRLMSASFLLAGVGLTGCRRPVEKVEPFARLPEGYLHGVPQHYATALPVRSSAVPLVVKVYDGRPIKIEGNADHPANRLDRPAGQRRHGGTDSFAQASVLDLYDPDRARRFTEGGANVTREQALDRLARVAQQSAATRGQGLCFLLSRSSSPSRARLQRLITHKLPQARWYIHEPVDFDVHRQAASLLFGQPLRPYYRLENARRILSLDCDFLAGEEEAHRLIRGFTQGRRLPSPEEPLNRLYAVESLYSLTGASADHRLRLPPSQVFPLACLLFAEFVEQTKAADQTPQAGPFAAELRGRAGSLSPKARDWARVCVQDLIAAGGAAVVLAGHRQPLAVHLLAHAFNAYLGAAGQAVVYLHTPAPTEGTITELAARLNAGEVDTLVVLGGNPVYDAPAELDWAKTQRKAKTVIRLGDREDETFPVTDWHLPLAHYLESWGDARTGDGTLVPIQPMIEPLFGGLTELEVLARIGDLPNVRPHATARDTFRELVPDGPLEENWKRLLHDGFWPSTAAKPVGLGQPDWPNAAPAILAAEVVPAPGAQDLEVVFARDQRVDDGRYANNGWLQELPDPITKITWDNVILLSPQTAQNLGVAVVNEIKNNLAVPVLRLELNGRTLEGPAWIQPGLADHTIGLALGYGRPAAGRVGRGVGYSAYTLRTAAVPHLARGARLTKTGRTYPLSCTQDHWFMEGRAIVREANLDEYRANRRFAQAMDLQEPPIVAPLYPNPLDQLDAHATHRWGMALDLNTCVGCATCSVACQSENNIPIVGKDQVRRNREMHWIRIDRYFTGPPSDPQVVHQPMLCQHCEAAPCESVCPVNATVHDDEGLNLMVYNRCVGTRYCSNNCPYKVRRFNFFDYHRRPLDRLYRSPLTSATDGEWELKRWFKNPDRGSRPQEEWDLLRLAQNPDVTVRMRGVMEKCSFCLQRLQQAKITRKVQAAASGNVTVQDDTIQTACQQACPADAITFGNLKDPDSRVSLAQAGERTYRVLEHLYTKPRVTYLARVRNPNPAMPDYTASPYSTEEFRQHGGTVASPGHATAGQGGFPAVRQPGAH